MIQEFEQIVRRCESPQAARQILRQGKRVQFQKLIKCKERSISPNNDNDVWGEELGFKNR